MDASGSDVRAPRRRRLVVGCGTLTACRSGGKLSKRLVTGGYRRDAPVSTPVEDAMPRNIYDEDHEALRASAREFVDRARSSRAPSR